ncbi:YdcF family protein [Flavisolibacter tropicus]|uniref:DUF218 domain-containing protein n=1 Tax=Flavisolibacter tropicus TaxID=1492898 RepID=A0A172U043_9BACT|nr:YdcF family protein [Flavisolibacter tropicus]ANE52721.1 hypothetical protein SY85_21815 [Flavisolibacter tropicus]
MFFILSKILFFLLAPLIWIITTLAMALFAKKDKRRKRALVTTAALLLLFTNPFISNEAWLLWERGPKPIATLPTYDAAIILTGLTDMDKSPHDRVYTNKGADRVLHTLQLYKLGKVQHIIISGGNGSLKEKITTEAESLRQLLVQAGVPDSVILMEDKSRNTYENARFTKQLLSQHPDLKKLLLVTSAFHMRRAEACFKKAGVVADTYPADFYTHDRSWDLDKLLLPQEAVLSLWQKLLHEMAGYVVYKVVGYC